MREDEGEMYCPKCGAQQVDTAKFCGKCGYAFAGKSKTQKKSKKGIYLIGGMIILLAIVGAVFLGMQGKKEKEYARYISSAEKYIQQLDYEQAEAAYLQAIKIAPKEKEPYVKLARLYIEQGEEEKAEEIIRQAEGKTVEKNAEIEKEEKEVKEIIEERKYVMEYRWVLEPSVEADDIYYVPDFDVYTGEFGEQSLNTTYQQIKSEYAIIKKEDALGLIDFDGHMKGGTSYSGMDYKNISAYGGDYFLEMSYPVWSDEYGMEWEYYWLYDDEIVPGVGIGDMFAAAFYYCDGLQEVNGDVDYAQISKPVTAIPVKQSDTIYDDDDVGCYEWWAELPGKYGIYYQDEMQTEFIYEACGSESEGLLAVCKDGKWGYVNSYGEEIIPIEYDASWIPYEPEVQTIQLERDSFCYAASDGYVVLRKNDMWELRDTTGKLAIPTGEFEEIRPVVDGKCWVKKDGKWGVIELSGRKYETEEAETEEAQAEQKGEQSAVSDEDEIAVWESELEQTEEKAAELEEKFHNSLTQAELNQYSYELYTLWDKEINALWGHLKNTLSENDMEELKKVQREWIKEKEAAIEAAGKEWEGGSGQPMAENMAGWEMTEERVYELAEYMK